MAIQPQLFNPDLEPIQYIADNGTFELTLDGKLKTFWVSQKQIADMFNLTPQTISHHVKNFKDDRPDESTYRNFRIVQREGNRDVERDVEHYNHSVVIYIGYRAQASSETIRFQRFVEEVFRQRMEAEHARAIHKAQHARAADVTSYILSGKTQSHAEKRVDMKSTVKQLNAIIIELSDARMVGAIVSKEYLLMLGKLADELKVILHTKNVRDGLSEMQLEYLDLIEKNIIRVLSMKDRYSREELLTVAENTIRPLATNYRQMCEAMGIDLVSGRKQLGRGS